MEHAEYTYTTGMDDAEMESFLQSKQTGVLSLADDGEAYAVPLAYHYDGTSLFLRVGRDADSKKMRFIETTDTASFLVYEDEPPEEAWSIMALGGLRELSPTEQDAFDETTINELFIPIRVFGESIEEVALTIFEFEIEELTGRLATE